MNRRGFLFGLGAAIAAPAVVRSVLLMPVRQIPTMIVPDLAAGALTFDQWAATTIMDDYIAHMVQALQQENETMLRLIGDAAFYREPQWPAELSSNLTEALR